MLACRIPNSFCNKSVELGIAFFPGLIHFCSLLFPFALLFSILSHPDFFLLDFVSFKFSFFFFYLFVFLSFFIFCISLLPRRKKIHHNIAARLLTMIVFFLSLQRWGQQNEKLYGWRDEVLYERPFDRKPNQRDRWRQSGERWTL